MKGRFLMGENYKIGEGWRIKNGGVRLWRLWKKVNSIFWLRMVFVFGRNWVWI